MSVRRAAVVFGAAALVTAFVTGCAGKAPRFDEAQVIFADGFYMELWILGEQRYATLYRVNGTHHLGFGGGADAFNQDISWVGTLGDEQYAELQRLLELHGWFAGTVSSTGEPPDRVSRVNLRWPGGSRRFKVKGNSADIEPVRQLLDDAARQRLQRDLQRLPEAGEELYK